METDRLISLRVVGQMLGGVCVRTVRRRIATGELPRPVYFGRTPMLSLLEVTAVIEELKRKRSEKGYA
jgi:predicted DNA-binding transcriptional regulator AlpA